MKPLVCDDGNIISSIVLASEPCDWGINKNCDLISLDCMESDVTQLFYVPKPSVITLHNYYMKYINIYITVRRRERTRQYWIAQWWDNTCYLKLCPFSFTILNGQIVKYAAWLLHAAWRGMPGLNYLVDQLEYLNLLCITPAQSLAHFWVVSQ